MLILKRCIIKIKISVVTQSCHVQQTLVDVVKCFYRTPTHNPSIKRCSKADHQNVEVNPVPHAAGTRHQHTIKTSHTLYVSYWEQTGSYWESATTGISTSSFNKTQQIVSPNLCWIKLKNKKSRKRTGNNWRQEQSVTIWGNMTVRTVRQVSSGKASITHVSRLQVLFYKWPNPPAGISGWLRAAVTTATAASLCSPTPTTPIRSSGRVGGRGTPQKSNVRHDPPTLRGEGGLPLS